MLYLKYRQLRHCSQDERIQTCEYIRKEINKIIQNDRSNKLCIMEAIAKKQKTEKSTLDQYKDLTDDESNSSAEPDDDIDFDVIDYKPAKADKFTKYLEMYIDKTRLSQNLLEFWKENRTVYLILPQVERKIHCIPATPAAVEQQFSGASVVLNERRTSLDSEYLDNTLFIGAKEKIKGIFFDSPSFVFTYLITYLFCL